MACPLCGEECRCSFAGPTRSAPSILMDPDQPDRSEEQFTASLERSGTPVAAETAALPDPAAETAALRAEPPAPGMADGDAEEQWDLACSTPPSRAAVMNEPDWKQEVASRLEKYQARRGRRRPRHEGSLSLDFERAANRMAVEEPVVSRQSSVPSQTEEPGYQPHATAPMFEAEPAEATVSEPEPESNIIKFPRLPTLFEPVLPLSGNELAEPVIDRPRIYEVPEEVHCSQAPLAGIELEAEEPAPGPELELPLRVAPIGQRVFAAMIDALVVAVAVAVFVMVIVYLDVPPPPHGKAAIASAAALPCVLWSIYEYLFLVHAGRTPGMHLARLAISEFDGVLPGRRRRRARALATVLSLFPLGLGMLWALLDEDTLCWHDRISRTYLAGAAAD